MNKRRLEVNQVNLDRFTVINKEVEKIGWEGIQ